MEKLDLTATDAVLLTLCSIDDFLQNNAELKSFNVNRNGTATALYKLNSHTIAVKRDINNCSFSIQFQLKKHSAVCGKKIVP